MANEKAKAHIKRAEAELKAAKEALGEEESCELQTLNLNADHTGYRW